MDKAQLAQLPGLWLETVVKGMNVRRLHTEPTLMTHTVGHHSCGVAILCDFLCRGSQEEFWLRRGGIPTNKLLRAALYHDIPEYTTGDIPAPVKWRSDVLRGLLDNMEEEVFRKLPHGPIRLSIEEEHILKEADCLDLMTNCLVEAQLGNRSLYIVFDNIVSYYLKINSNKPMNLVGKHLSELLCNKHLSAVGGGKPW